MIHYGLSGCGYFGAEIGRQINAFADAQLVSCTSPGKTSIQFSQELSIQSYADFDAFLDHPQMDVVIIAGPNNTHAEQFIKAAQTGKKIYIEKPFALSFEDAKKMLQTAKECNTMFMVGHILHFYPRIQQTKTLLKQTGINALGKILTIHAERTGWEDAKEQVSWKKTKKNSGGHLFHHIHEIDLVQYFAGEAESVFCFADNLAHKSSSFGDEDDVLLLTIRHKNGVCSTMQYGSAFHFPAHFIRITCENGGIVLDFQNNLFIVKQKNSIHSEAFFSEAEKKSHDLYLQRGGGAGYGKSGQQIPHYLLNALIKELRCFHIAIQEKIIPQEFADLFDGSSALSSVKIASLAMQSALTHQVATSET